MLKHSEFCESNHVEICYFDSTNIVKSYYYPKTSTLNIVFNTGKVYEYNDVSNIDYGIFKESESQGKIFNTTIKKKNGVLLTEEDIKIINEELKKINDNERENFIQLAKIKMSKFIESDNIERYMIDEIIKILNYL